MRYVKGVLLGLFFLGLIMTGISLLMPSSVHSAESVTIYASQPRITSQLHDLRSWPDWFPFSSDTTTPIDFSFVQADGNYQSIEWRAKDAINRLEPVKADTNGLFFRWTRQGESPLVIHFSILPMQEEANSLQWTIHTELKWYPWERFSGIFFDQQVKPSQKKALEKLKTILEKKG